MAAGKTLKSILVSCGARLAPFDIQEVRDITMYDELELDTLGDRKTALFLIMSDTDATFSFLIAMIYTQMFNLLCEKADDVYGGRLPVHVRCLIDEAANIGQIPNLEQGQRRYDHRQHGFEDLPWRHGTNNTEGIESGARQGNDRYLQHLREPRTGTVSQPELSETGT